MSRKTIDNIIKSQIIFEVDRLECPFREFRDNELQPDAWGLGTAAFRAHTMFAKLQPPKPSIHETNVWTDDQTQPLPRSVRHYLHGWVRAEELAENRWGADVVIFEDDTNNSGKMAVSDIQLSHAQVLLRSSFCRRVLSICYMLERVECLVVEHQWDNFVCSFTPDGWRAKYHILSPGTKPGGGAQHKPQLSKNGCYLVRLFYLGAWRCVWVSDQVPVDANDSPLLPFSPLVSRPPATKPGPKAPPAVTSGVVHLWPLLLCKALLKLAAPDMNSDEDLDYENIEDEPMPEFDILHTLTGCMNLTYVVPNVEDLWELIISEVPVFSWDEDDETLASTVKSRSTKKPNAKDVTIIRRNSMMYLVLNDSKDLPPYYLPGITPGHEMSLLITMARDKPLKKPPPEPELALWKYYRWIDWARQHGLYDSYECPRTQYLKVNGLLKLSHAPHLLDVCSTESITVGFIEEHKSAADFDNKDDEKSKKDKKREKELQKTAMQQAYIALQATKEELRQWIQYLAIASLVKKVHIVYYPSLFQLTAAGSNPPLRSFKSTNKTSDVVAPKSAPLYLQIDGPEDNRIMMSLSTLNPRILSNAGAPFVDFIEPAYLVLEKFEWFIDEEIPMPKAYIRTDGYESVEVVFPPGRHFCRVWVHSRMNWHVMCISESSMLLGTRDQIQSASTRDCPWAFKFLSYLGTSFSFWAKQSRANPFMCLSADRDFFRSYLPDLPWDDKVVGYNRALLHWMFRKALQSHLSKRLLPNDYKTVCNILRKYFLDPDFGFPDKPKPPKSLRDIADIDPCDCIMPEMEESECMEEAMEEMEKQESVEEKPIVAAEIMDKLLKAPKPPIASQVCELATEEVPCGILKDEREKMIRKHEAAAVIQAHWRGTWARKCLKGPASFTNEVMRLLQDYAFGNQDALSKLMNEFFSMFPGARYAYSVASALSGIYGVNQHVGTTPVTTRCKWIPFFQGVFFCHYPVKVHFDLYSNNVLHCTIAVYDNDSGEQLPQACNAHLTFNFRPNVFGYTVTGHGTLTQTGYNFDAHWQFTVMSCIDGVFHICDNDEFCRELSLSHASKLHLDEIYIPNRRNILGGIQLNVTKHEYVSFRAAATSPDLLMEATLRSISQTGETKIIATCSGKGEIYWPYIRLEQSTPPFKGVSTVSMIKTVNIESKLYSIEVTCPCSWPLSLNQWKRVDEIRNAVEIAKLEHTPVKKPGVKTVSVTPKPGSAKDKEKDKDKDKSPTNQPVTQKPQPDDAYVELECALPIGGGVVAKRDDTRDIQFANARRFWDLKEPGRNQRGAQIRNEFRTEFLEAPPTIPSVSMSIPDLTTMGEETEYEEEKKDSKILVQGPSPASESAMLDMSLESEEEAMYTTMPEQLRDKFIPLYFLPFCMKEKIEDETVLVTPDIAEAAKQDRHARIEAAIERMHELQTYNEEYVLGRQKERCQLLEKLFVDGTWCTELHQVLEERDEAIATEALNRTLSATKKKQEGKKK